MQPSLPLNGATPVRAAVALAALSLLFFLITAGSFTALGVVLPDMVLALHWSWSAAGMGYTLLALACGLASLAPAILARRIGVRATLVVGGVLLALGYLLLAGSGQVERFWFGAALIGAGFALTAIIPGTFVLARLFSHRATALGAYYAAGALGGVAGPALYHLAQALGLDWRSYWLTFGGLILAVAIGAALSLPRQASGALTEAEDPADDVSTGTVRDALLQPQFWAVTAAYTAYLLCETSLNGLCAPHMTEQGLAPAFAAGLISLQALVNMLARLFGGVLAERISAKRLALVSLVLVTLGMAALGFVKGPLFFTLAVTAVGVGYGLSSLATPLLLLTWFGRRRNLDLMSIMCLVSTLAAVGPWLGGLVKDQSGAFAPAFAVFGLVSLLALIGLVVTLEPQSLAGRPKP